jgi:hypothetical protein
MNDGMTLFRSSSSICHVVVLRYFEASKIVIVRGMIHTGTDRSVEAGAGMDTTATGATVRVFWIGMGKNPFGFSARACS